MGISKLQKILLPVHLLVQLDSIMTSSLLVSLVQITQLVFHLSKLVLVLLQEICIKLDPTLFRVLQLVLQDQQQQQMFANVQLDIINLNLARYNVCKFALNLLLLLMLILQALKVNVFVNQDTLSLVRILSFVKQLHVMYHKVHHPL